MTLGLGHLLILQGTFPHLPVKSRIQKWRGLFFLQILKVVCCLLIMSMDNQNCFLLLEESSILVRYLPLSYASLNNVCQGFRDVWLDVPLELSFSKLCYISSVKESSAEKQSYTQV